MRTHDTLIKLTALAMLSIVVSSCQSNEKKALGLIDQYMKTVLYDYDSYEPTSVKVDSAYSTIYIMQETLQMAQAIVESQSELQKEMQELERNNSDMALWFPSPYESAFARQQYATAKKKAEENSKNIAELEKSIKAAKDGIRDYAKTFTSEYMGWGALLSYRCNTIGGIPHIGSGIFYFDRDFKEITFCISNIDEEYNELVETIKQCIEQE